MSARTCAGLTVVVLLAAAAALRAQPPAPVPALTERVTDLTGTLNASQKSALEAKLAAFEERKGSQVSVLIVPTTAPESIEQYSIRVVEQWKLGRKSVDDGALLLIAKNDHALRIEVGYGLEGVLTDATSNRIIDEIIIPAFRRGDFAGGIDAGVDRMLGVIDGEPLPPPKWPAPGRRPTHGGGRGVLSLLPFLIGAALIANSVLSSMFGRGLGAALTGGGMGFIVWVLSGVIAIAAFAGLATFMFGLLSGIAGTSRWSSMPRGGWGGFGGGGFGGGGFGGGGFGGGGGFSGGGGGFGGGGASGRW